MFQPSFRRELLQILIDIGLSRLRTYERIVEDVLNREKKDLKAEVEQVATTLPEEQREKFCESYADEYQELSRVYPDILRSSLLRMYCSFFEYRLIEVYKEYKKCYSAPNIDNITRGSQIEKIQKCMKEVKFRFPDQTPEWDNIKHYFYIRHTLTHNEGKLNKKKKWYKQTEKFIQNNNFLTLDQLEHIHFDRPFVEQVAENMGTFFNNLFKVLPIS